uniref:protein-tyrosine-phosphatase n=1 Tax=Saccoglossus kowalevskii TaxID=10224 RepID=A0ABM0M0S1_SACKO|nr:PREDICTED: cyclin-dependent kinase inhibitor 3-like [Saccoglossus kowalevskii]
MNNFDSSDEEGDTDLSPFKIDWIDYSLAGCPEFLGISGLPGCRFKDTWRSLSSDIETLKSEGITEIFILCTRGELSKYRVPRLLQEYQKADIVVHHYSFPDGSVPSVPNCMKMLEEIRVCLMSGRKAMVHCFGGLGRSCLVAVCLMGSGAIQTVKQYNFIHDFRRILEEHESSQENEIRSISR